MFRFLNYQRDPHNKGRRVFYYREPAEAEDMKRMLQLHQIAFLELIDPKNPEVSYLSVDLKDFDQASELNSRVLAKYSRKFIPDRTTRTVLMVIFICGFLLSVVGYIIHLTK
ncbi:MAG: hypothetical protein NZM65_06710 [Flavobacteriales bacterium]|nr:hypothetical protein [Flavobacteriales bacterium]MDW8410365.1 hypothetical protein [Flavobacteriales bacterium]